MSYGIRDPVFHEIGGAVGEAMELQKEKEIDIKLKEKGGNYDDTKTFKENIKRLWLKFSYFGINNPYIFQFILIFHSSPYITSLTKEQVENRFVELIVIYRKGIEKDEIKQVYNEMVVDYFWGNIFATVSHFGKYPEKLNEGNIDLAFELFWDGISK